MSLEDVLHSGCNVAVRASQIEARERIREFGNGAYQLD